MLFDSDSLCYFCDSIPCRKLDTLLAETASHTLVILLTSSCPKSNVWNTVVLKKYCSWGMDVEWNTVWGNLHLWRFLRPARNTNWLIAHGVLPTADGLRRFRMSVDSLCHCGQPEDLLHLFTQCNIAPRLVTWYQSLVRKVTSSCPDPTPSQILVGHRASAKIAPVFPCLLGIIRHQLWLARNRFRFDHTVVTYGTILASVKSSLCFTLRIERRNCLTHLFSELWLGKGVFGFVSREDVIVFPEELW